MEALRSHNQIHRADEGKAPVGSPPGEQGRCRLERHDLHVDGRHYPFTLPCADRSTPTRARERPVNALLSRGSASAQSQEASAPRKAQAEDQEAPQREEDAIAGQDAPAGRQGQELAAGGHAHAEEHDRAHPCVPTWHQAAFAPQRVPVEQPLRSASGEDPAEQQDIPRSHVPDADGRDAGPRLHTRAKDQGLAAGRQR